MLFLIQTCSCHAIEKIWWVLVWSRVLYVSPCARGHEVTLASAVRLVRWMTSTYRWIYYHCANIFFSLPGKSIHVLMVVFQFPLCVKSGVTVKSPKKPNKPEYWAKGQKCFRTGLLSIIRLGWAIKGTTPKSKSLFSVYVQCGGNNNNWIRFIDTVLFSLWLWLFLPFESRTTGQWHFCHTAVNPSLSQKTKKKISWYHCSRKCLLSLPKGQKKNS